MIALRTALFIVVLVTGAALVLVAATVERRTDVHTEVVASGPMITTLVASCQTRMPRTAKLGSEAGGRVQSVAVEAGNRVRKGDLLAALAADEMIADVATAEAELRIAEAALRRLIEVDWPRADLDVAEAEQTLDAVRTDYDRTNELTRRGAEPAVSLRDAVLKLQRAEQELAALQIAARALAPGGSGRAVAEGEVDRAEAALAARKVEIAQRRILAPFDGTVLSREVEPGEWVQTGASLFTLQPAGRPRIACAFDERNMAALRQGQHATAVADAFADQPFPAFLQSIGAFVDADRGTVDVELEVPEAPDFLRQGMTVSVEIETGAMTSAVVVPVSALVPSGPHVFVVDDGRARIRPVVTGYMTEGLAEVTSGLHAGETVVVDPPSDLEDGARIREKVP